MKKKLSLFMAAVMLLTTPASVSLAYDTSDAVIIEDDIIDVGEEAETETSVSGETETVMDETEDTEETGETQLEEDLIMIVEEAEDPLDEPATVSIVDSGTCGDNLTWKLNSSGTLIISGSGNMDDYTLDYEPDEESKYLSGSYYDENGRYCEIYSYSKYNEVWSAPWADCASAITSVTFGEGVTSIGAYAFYECENIKSISISDTVVTIGTQAFYHCIGLTNITIPDSVITIGDCAFFWCTGVTSVTLGNNVTTIERAAFDGCNSLTSMTVPKSVTSIGSMAIGYEYGESQYGQGSDPMEFTIYGYTGTAAETYAATSDKFTFVALDSSTVTLDTCKISSLTNVAKGIKIKWSQVSGASGYIIYRKTATGSYTKVKTIKSGSTVSYTDKKVVSQNGTVYTYKVIPYSGSTKGSGTEVTTARLTGTALTSVKNSSAGKAKVKWTAVSSVSGYQIQYSTSSSFDSSKKKTVSGASKNSKTLTGLTKGSTYYVRIRTYKTVNGTRYYSAWSSKLKVTITK
ncbi:MAG: leucine-rich repeat protein [Clostridiales bacterium]|nr:leucine-rich repeat protein [Clostridiales bacterium]